MVLTTQTQVQSGNQSATLAEEVLARCRRLASCSEDSDGIRRTFLSPPMRDVHREITNWLEEVGAKVRIDAAGNLRAVYPGEGPSPPRLLFGSHLDTVPNAGAYDGVLGVLIALALLKDLRGRRLPFALEVVGFSEEEGVRFGAPFIGSRALVGRLDEDLLNTCDAKGVSVRRAIEEFGLNPAEMSDAELSQNAFGYVEFHIEQGPVLEKVMRPLAVVEAIAGQSRLEFVFTGRANHAGTTPMDMRFDAVAGAAEWITAVEREANNNAGLVATVGSVKTAPGASNVICAEAQLTLDVRHRENEVRTRAVAEMTLRAEEIARRRRLSVRHRTRMNQLAVPMDPFLNRQIGDAIRKTGVEPHAMVSGGGHDAMIMAEKIPSAMIFLRTPGGISHHPAESVAVEDVQRAIECGHHLLEQLSSSPASRTQTETRTRRA